MTRPKKIVVAYDGSVHSKEALNWAVDLSLLTGAPVIAAKVVELVEINRVDALNHAEFGANLSERFAELHEADIKQMEEAVETGRKKGVVVKPEMISGNVARSIIDYADQNGADLIIAGTKGHGALTELLIGSVVRNLLSLSDIPVLVVKATAE